MNGMVSASATPVAATAVAIADRVSPAVSAAGLVICLPLLESLDSVLFVSDIKCYCLIG